MPYTLRRTDGSILLNIPDQTINKNELPIALVGRGAINYGTDFAENFIHLLENFANLSAPTRPMTGMLWFDMNEREMKVYTGTEWRQIVGNTSVQPLPSSVVMRDENGNITANTFIGNLQGNASTADKWRTPRSFTMTGDATGSTLIDGSQNIVIETSIVKAGSSNHSTTSDKFATARRIRLAGQVDGEALFDGSQDITINCSVTDITGEAIGTPENQANKIVRRDPSGNFAATRITANLTGNADSATKLQTARTLALVGNVTGSVTFDGSADASITTTLASIPATAIPATGVTAASYTLASITVASDGRITAASNGSLPASGVTAGTYTNANITVGTDGRIVSATNGSTGSTTVPPHTHPLSDIQGLDNRINEVTNVTTIKGMRRVAGPNVAYVYTTFALYNNNTGRYDEYRVPAGAFVVGTALQWGTHGGVGSGTGTPATPYLLTEYIQYYVNGSWVNIG